MLPDDCNSDWLLFEGNCYFFGVSKLSWINAQVYFIYIFFFQNADILCMAEKGSNAQDVKLYIHLYGCLYVLLLSYVDHFSIFLCSSITWRKQIFKFDILSFEYKPDRFNSCFWTEIMNTMRTIELKKTKRWCGFLRFCIPAAGKPSLFIYSYHDEHTHPYRYKYAVIERRY